MRKLIGAAALALFLLATQQPLRAQQVKPTLSEKATILGKLTDSRDTRAVSISDDYNHLAILAEKNKKYFITLDGTPGKEYEWIVRGSLGFTLDSKHFAYVVQQGEDMFAVVDGREGKAYKEIAASNFTFAPVGARYGYYAKPKGANNNKWVVVVDGQESKEFDQVGNLIFSPDGKRVAYGVEQGGKQYFVVDNTPEREFDKVAGNSFTWSPDSKRYAYGAVRDTKVIIMADGKEGKPYKESTRPLFSPDSNHLVYVGTPEDKKAQLVADGKEQKQYRRIISESIRFSPDSSRLAYIATRGDPKDPAKEEMFFVIDDQETPNYDALVPGSFVFSPDSKRTCFQCAKNKKLIAVIDGLEGREYDDIKLAQFSPDSKKVAYIAARERRVYAVVDGAEGRGYDGIANLMFSKDGKLAYVVARDKKQAIAINGVESKNEYEAIVHFSLAFSPDGKHLAYEAKRDNKPVFVVDDAESKPHAGSLQGSRIAWDSPTSLHTLVLRGDKKDEKDVVRLQLDLTGG